MYCTVLIYHKPLVEEEGLLHSNLIQPNADGAFSPSPPTRRPGRKKGNFKYDHCENRFKQKRKLKKHSGNKNRDAQKSEEIRGEELDKNLITFPQN